MTKFLLAPDSFKGSLSSSEVCDALENGIKSFIDTEIYSFPSSDGGEGFCECMHNIIGGEVVTHSSFDALGRPINTSFVFCKNEKTAYIELAAASGLCLINKDDRDIMRSSTFGTGLSIREAILLGAKKIIIGLGGSATNDCGMGILAALGAKFYGEDGEILSPSAENTAKTVKCDYIELHKMIGNVVFTAACDVKNKLCGKSGASYVFGPQKGASPEQAEFLDNSLSKFSEIAGIDKNAVGSGAAGGAGAALLSILGAKYVSGASLLINSPSFEKALKECDVVITGEGNTDMQSCEGKLVSVVAAAAKEHNKPCYVISGGLSKGYEILREHGVTGFVSLTDESHNADYCIKHAYDMLTERASSLIKHLA